jgi:presequence protease
MGLLEPGPAPIGRLPGNPPRFAGTKSATGRAPDLPPHEGLVIPAQVNYVGKGANLYEHGYQMDGSILVITPYLRSTYFYEKVRVQGGAYGGFCLFDRYSGIFSFLSYRDPNLMETLRLMIKPASS